MSQTGKSQPPFQRPHYITCCQFFTLALWQYHMKIPGIFHYKKWQCQLQYQEKKKKKRTGVGGAK